MERSIRAVSYFRQSRRQLTIRGHLVMTNNALLSSDSQIDLAFITFDPATQLITVQPDPNLSAVGANVFIASSGLLTNAYQISNGAMHIQSKDNWQTIAIFIHIPVSFFSF